MISKEISSLQHPLVKHWVRLRTSASYRLRENALLITGENILSELANAHTFNYLIIQKGTPLPRSIPCKEICVVSEEILKKITGLVQPGPMAAELPLPPLSDLRHCERILVIDQVNDPGNLGTLIRSALAFGWDGAFLLEGSADPFNDKALRASKGAVFRLKLARGDEHALAALIATKKWTVYGADMAGRAVEENFSYPPPFMLILGNEAQGLSASSRQNSSLLSLPMPGAMESLNVAVAGSIFMFLLRKR